MNEVDKQLDSLDTARAAMRSRLSQEFRALHRRRRQVRVAAACVVPIALVAAIAAWHWSNSPQKQPPAPPMEQLANGLTPSASTAKPALEIAPKLVESTPSPAPPQAAGFRAIEFIELKPKDLPTWLAEAKSDLIVYQVNGRTEVVSEQELLEASTKKRNKRVN